MGKNTKIPESVEPIENNEESIELEVELEEESVEPIENNEDKLQACFDANPNAEVLYQNDKDGQCFFDLNHAEPHQRLIGGKISLHER